MSKILIVEDDAMNCLVFSRVLTKRGNFEVRCTEDVNDVLETAQQGDVDIILMDIGLPNSFYEGKAMSGVHITQLLKANPTTAEIPVVLVTAFNMPGDRERYLKESGADGYIPKPVVDHESFVAQVHHYMNDGKTPSPCGGEEGK
ncbi:response regulator [Spirulina sp. CCNP1310]|uniref:response regulator n=1 Tax=Spirulina sp. CCNP1310 TaxID=3110249 RepID=UPI002B220E85|nr:response regulator [Spirulina sp. CCNP1310]MEA5418886.1 response regulator [Spirulina sp. CCNP1310]